MEDDFGSYYFYSGTRSLGPGYTPSDERRGLSRRKTARHLRARDYTTRSTRSSRKSLPGRSGPLRKIRWNRKWPCHRHMQSSKQPPLRTPPHKTTATCQVSADRVRTTHWARAPVNREKNDVRGRKRRTKKDVEKKK